MEAPTDSAPGSVVESTLDLALGCSTKAPWAITRAAPISAIAALGSTWSISRLTTSGPTTKLVSSAAAS